MLREISSVRQESGELLKQWYTNSNIDIFVWLNPTYDIESFQCSYEKTTSEKALLWDKRKGFSHVSVDDGAKPGRHPTSPMFIENKDFEPAALYHLFDKEVGELPSPILSEVLAMIKQHFSL